MSFGPEVIVINTNGEFLGQMPTTKALELARQQDLDLIEVNKQKGISVCKIMDRGKWKYEQKKNKKTHTHSFKEMKFGMRIDTHDQDTKVGHIRRFLDKGLSVRVVVEMRGRERQHPEFANQKLDVILSGFEGKVRTEGLRRSNANISIIVHPSGKDNNASGKAKESHDQPASADNSDTG